MKKKLIMLIAAVMCVCAAVVMEPTDVKAMTSCSQATIDAANAQIASAQAAYAAAQTREAQALANLNAVKASNPSELQLTVAANAYTTAQNATRWYLDQVNNAKAYLVNISGRAALETAWEETNVQLKNLSGMQDAKLTADGAQAVANGVLEQIKAKENAIAGYKQMLATCPSVQTQIDTLNREIVALQADYAAKQAVADAKKAALNTAIANDHYDQYTKDMLDYWWQRDHARNHDPHCGCNFCKMARGVQ